ncbi:MAG: DEAD/DEAH box helicase family protein [Chloroflexota bacterium]|nr:DEAD/DEAH box helicase family protein [Chloroflexota bacterium]
MVEGTATAIDNPVINTPFAEPVRHFVTTPEGQVTGEIEDRRRPSEFFVPVAPPRKRSAAQLTIDQFGSLQRQQPNEIVNEIRQAVARWRAQDYPDVTSITRDLLAYWRDEDRERRLFFCQVEAAETAIYLTEAAERTGDANALNQIRTQNAALNGGLPRLAFKMATGSGKTVVMAMLIAWQALNKQANQQDRRFSDRFLIVTPGITIRDRLRVLLPNDPTNYYQSLDIVTPEQLARLQSATILITNYHAFIRREKIQAASLTKKVLAGGDDERFRETPAEMVRRVCRDFGNAKNIVVINDEAHHCYAPAPREQAQAEAIDADERALAKENQEEARVWLSGLQAVQEKLGIRSVFDLSATPFFLKGSGYPEGTLFPWVVTDFGLMDAIESGIVKVPRVPVSDDSMTGTGPMYRELWSRVREALPRKGIRDTPIDGSPTIPKELEGALRTLYADYERSFDEWAGAGIGTPPVFIVVCSNTATSKLVYDWIAGWEKPLDDGKRAAIVPGNLPLFSNEQDGRLRPRPNTILVDSAQLDRGDALDPAFRKAAHAEIEAFKREYVARFPGRSADEITDEDILREVMNTVGKKDRLGEHVRCVVSVAMLTEGWDANTVTHILGVRAFGTQLLCEQVVGRALRRASYDADENGMFDAQYAEVYGVPFSFLSVAGKGRVKRAKPVLTVRALPERADLRIEFPRLVGYRYQMPADRLDARFDASSILQLSTQDVALKTQVDPIVGKSEIHTLDELRSERLQTVVFTVAKRTLDNHFRDDDGGERPWLFPQLARIVRQWIEECVEPYLKDGAFPQMLLFAEYSHAAAERIRQAIVAGTVGEKRLLPNLRAYEPIGSTDYVYFDTTKTCYDTEKSHINRVVQDSGWESKLADVLESMPEVVAYAKNQGLNFKIPYTYEGRAANYVPDFLIRLRDSYSEGDKDLLTLIIEVTGEAKKEKQAKVAAAEHLWIPAVNNWGGAGRWAFLEVTDPWDAKNLIEARLLRHQLPASEAVR